MSSSCFTSRRSHLDSASYRTLVRIFSLCGGGSLDSSNPNPNLDGNPNSAAEEFVQHPSTEKDSVTRESGDGPNPNCQLAEESGDGKRRNEEGGGIEKGTAFANPNLEIYNAVKRFEFDDDEFVDLDLLEGVMNDCAKLFDEPEQDDASGGRSLEIKNQESSGSEKGANFEKIAVVETRDGDFGSEKEETGVEQEKDANSHELEDPGECFNGEGVERMMEIEEGTQSEIFANSEPLIDDADFEEGEIPNDFEKPNESVDLACKPALYEDEKLEEGSICEHFDKNQNSNYTMPTFSRINLIEAHHDQGLNAFGDNKCLEPEHKKSFGYTDDDVRHGAGVPDTLVLSTNKEKEKPSKAEVLLQVFLIVFF